MVLIVAVVVDTFGDRNVPKLDAIELAEKLELAAVMVCADDVTHVATEAGIANLLLCAARRSAGRRSAALPATPMSAAAICPERMPWPRSCLRH